MWEIGENPESWQQDLESFYKNRPVFAVISGLTEGSWEPINAAYEKNKVPCLLPHTDLPETTRENIYSVHFNEGLELAARAMMQSIQNGVSASHQAKVLQINHTSSQGVRPAQIFKQRFAGIGLPSVETRSYSKPAEFRSIDFSRAIRRSRINAAIKPFLTDKTEILGLFVAISLTRRVL